MSVAQYAPSVNIDIDALVKSRIQDLCLFFGYSHSVLDRLAGFRTGTVKKLVDTDQRVYASHLIRISKKTGVMIDYFYNPDASLPTAASTTAYESFCLVQAFQSIDNPSVKQDVFELIEALQDETPKSQP